MRNEDMDIGFDRYMTMNNGNYRAYYSEESIDNMKTDFFAGAEWRINSVWHTMDEVQDGKRPYIVQYNEEWKFAMFTKPISIPKEQAKLVFKRWAYMDDLIPDTED